MRKFAFLLAVAFSSAANAQLVICVPTESQVAYVSAGAVDACEHATDFAGGIACLAAGDEYRLRRRDEDAARAYLKAGKLGVTEADAKFADVMQVLALGVGDKAAQDGWRIIHSIYYDRCEGNDADACYKWAKLNAATYEKEAAKRMEKACDLGSAAACRHLIREVTPIKGKGFSATYKPDDLDKVLRYYSNACFKGSEGTDWSCDDLAALVIKIEGLQYRVLEKKANARSCQKGHLLACYKLATTLEKENKKANEDFIKLTYKNMCADGDNPKEAKAACERLKRFK